MAPDLPLGASSFCTGDRIGSGRPEQALRAGPKDSPPSIRETVWRQDRGDRTLIPVGGGPMKCCRARVRGCRPGLPGPGAHYGCRCHGESRFVVWLFLGEESCGAERATARLASLTCRSGTAHAATETAHAATDLPRQICRSRAWAVCIRDWTGSGRSQRALCGVLTGPLADTHEWCSWSPANIRRTPCAAHCTRLPASCSQFRSSCSATR